MKNFVSFLKVFFLILLLVLIFGCSSPGLSTDDTEAEEKEQSFVNPDNTGPDRGVIEGTDKNDTLIGTTGDDTIYAKGGNDLIFGRGGCDYIHGGKGNDVIYVDGHYGGFVYGENDNDIIYGGTGRFILIDGGYGNDVIYVPSGGCMDVVGGAGNDRIEGSDDNEWIYPGPGIDRIYTKGSDENTSPHDRDVIYFYGDEGEENYLYLGKGEAGIPFQDRGQTSKVRAYIYHDDDGVGAAKDIMVPTSFTLTHTYYDKNNYTNYYAKKNGKIIYTITIHGYTSDSKTHWIEIVRAN